MELIFKCKLGLCMNLTMQALQIKRGVGGRMGGGGRLFLLQKTKDLKELFGMVVFFRKLCDGKYF